jgi:hypothetical protein
MEVSYERTGGFAGMRMAASFNLDELPGGCPIDRDCLHQAPFHVPGGCWPGPDAGPVYVQITVLGQSNTRLQRACAIAGCGS